ncbi:MAG: tetratricopeptide repeat protein, partial [Deltaproteobacteria bacterium]
MNLIVGFSGCAHLLNQWQGEQDLRDAKRLLSNGQFSASEQKTSIVLQAFPKELGDEALFQLGLVYSHPENPAADYEKSRRFFERVLIQYPDSSRRDEAKAFRFALSRIADNDEKILTLEEKIRRLELSSESQEKTLRQLQDQLR